MTAMDSRNRFANTQGVGGMKETPEFMADLFGLSLPDCLKRMASEY